MGALSGSRQIKSIGLILVGCVTSVCVPSDKPQAALPETEYRQPYWKAATQRKLALKVTNRPIRPVTVPDVIRMTRVVGTGEAKYHFGGSLTENFAVFSSDEKHFVIVTQRGNLERNENEYRMLLYEAANVFEKVAPKTLVSFASSSNREGIKDAVWLDDNRTIMFLGEQSGKSTQVYTVDSVSGKISRITNQQRNVESFSTTPTGNRIACFVEPAAEPLVRPNAKAATFHITDEPLQDLIAGEIHTDEPELVTTAPDSQTAKKLRTLGKLPLQQGLWKAFVSPDGRYLVVPTDVMSIPKDWGRYKDAAVQTPIARRIREGSRTLLYHYELVDVQTGESRVLLNSPITYSGSEVAWAPDSRSVLLTGVYLPLDSNEFAEEAVRENKPFVLEVKLPNLQFIPITDENPQFVAWDARTGVVSLRSRGAKQNTVSDDTKRYQKQGSEWVRVAGPDESTSTPAPTIVLDQDLNSPPRVMALDSRTGRKAVLLDLNPQFKDLDFGKVEEVKWTGGGGQEFNGALFLPPDYVPGTHYPLVIQTHGFDPPGYPHRFWIDGPFSTAFAAQPLAGKGIVVLQVPDPGPKGDPQEAPLMMATLEKAIDYLDGRGLIDKNRVGMIGFSRTCLYVRYTLTHSKYQFAASVVADGIDAGYWQYIAYANAYPNIPAELDTLVGAAPFGEGLMTWFKYSPGFLLDQVRSPVLIQAIGPASLLSEWQWFSGLKSLHKAVDLIYLPLGAHVLQKPSDRVVSQGGTVDWMRFWLQGYEDPDPAKAAQYKRWRGLREVQEENEQKAKSPATPQATERERKHPEGQK